MGFVRNRLLMWGLYQNSKLWSQRPSAMVDITDPYTAYCFDEAVATWGTYVSNELERVEGKNAKDTERKRHNKLLQLLDAPASQRFRSLRASKGEGTVKR